MAPRKKISFKNLKDISTKKQMKQAQSEMPSMLAALTPTQFAAMFPDYYKQGTPDVGGFKLALTQKTQKGALETVGEEVSGAAATAKRKAGAAYDYVKTKLGLSKEKAMPALSQDELDAFSNIQKNPLAANSEQGKIFSKLSKTQLSSVGIESFKDEATGRMMFRYAQPEIDRGEAERALKSGASTSNPTLAQQVKYARSVAARTGADPNLITGILLGESGLRKPGDRRKEWSNVDWNRSHTQYGVSYGGFQLRKPGLGEDFEKQTGLKLTGETWKQQYDWAITKIARNGEAWARTKWMSIEDQEKRHGPDAIRRQGAEFMSSYGDLVSGAATSVDIKPEGPNGQYSDRQIVEMTEQLKNERNLERRQQLANLLANAKDKDQTATVNTGTDKWNEVTPKGTTHWCARGVVHLSKQIFRGNSYFDNAVVEGHGNAVDYTSGSNFFTNSGMYKAGERISKDKLTPEFLASLPPGTIIAQGGSDYASRFGHIQMKVGGQWMSDHVQRKGFYKDNVSGRNYDNFTIMRLSDQGRQTLEKSGYMTPSPVDKSQPQVAVVPTTPQAPPAPTKEDIAREVPVNALPDGQDVKSEQAPAPTPQATPTPTAEVKKPEPPKLPNKYNVDRAGFINAIKQTPEFKNNPLSWMATEDLIIDGFNKDPNVVAAGVKYDAAKGTMTFKNASDPQVQQIMKDLNTNKFMTPIKEEPKKEPPKAEVVKEKPVEPKKEEVRPAPTPTPTTTPATEAKPIPDAKSSAVEPKKEEIKKVNTAESGGSFNVGEGDIKAYPITGIKSDNTLVVNKQEQPLFTMNNNESAVYDASQNKVDVIPNQKAYAPGQQDNPLAGEFAALREEMGSVFSRLTENQNPVQTRDLTNQRDDNPNMLMELMNLNKQPFNNPSFKRAMNRIGFQETGDASTGFHFSHGNKNT